MFLRACRISQGRIAGGSSLFQDAGQIFGAQRGIHVQKRRNVLDHSRFILADLQLSILRLTEKHRQQISALEHNIYPRPRIVMSEIARTWGQRAAEKRDRIEKSIPPEWTIQIPPSGESVINFPLKSGILSPQELEITNSSATHLVKKLAAGELKSVDVTLAFCKRAALAHQLVGTLFSVSSTP